MPSWRKAGKRPEPVGEALLRVECYAGYKGEQRPIRLHIGEQAMEVVEITDRWYSPGATFFRVVVEGGASYILRHEDPQDLWSLAARRERA